MQAQGQRTAILSSLPLQIRPSLPRFLTVGDLCTLPVVVRSGASPFVRQHTPCLLRPRTAVSNSLWSGCRSSRRR